MARDCEIALLWSSSTLCLIALVFMIVSFATPYWGKDPSGTSSLHFGLWQICGSGSRSGSQCIDVVGLDDVDGRLRAGQAFGVMSLLSGVSTAIFQIIYLFLRNADMKTCIKVFAVLSSSFTLICFGVMGAFITGEYDSDWIDYSFGLMIVAWFLYTALVIISYFLPVRSE